MAVRERIRADILRAMRRHGNEFSGGQQFREYMVDYGYTTSDDVEALFGEVWVMLDEGILALNDQLTLYLIEPDKPRDHRDWNDAPP